MSAEAQMRLLGEHDGVRWYWAAPGMFHLPGVYYWDGGDNVRVEKAQPAPSPQPAVPVVSDEQIDACSFWEAFPGYLIDNHEGDVLTEEMLQHAASGLQAKMKAEGLAILALRPAVEPMTDDNARLDYLQERGATVDLVAGIVGPTPMRFRIGGLHTAVNSDIRKAIDAARGITAKAEGVRL